jgi:hypothetical protein
MKSLFPVCCDFFFFRFWSLLESGVFKKAWWGMPEIPALRRLKQEDCKLKANLDYTVKAYKGRKDKRKKGRKEGRKISL